MDYLFLNNLEKIYSEKIKVPGLDQNLIIVIEFRFAYLNITLFPS